MGENQSVIRILLDPPGVAIKIKVHVKLTEWSLRALLSLLVATVILMLLYIPYLDSDVAVWITLTDQWFNGQQFYVDMLDTNFPAMAYINLPFVALAKYLGINLPLTMIWAYLGLNLLLGGVVLLHLQKNLFKGYLFTAFFLLGVIWTYMGFSYGQRDIFIALLILPWMIFRANRVAGKEYSRGIILLHGFLCGLAIIIKPHYLIAAIAIELVLLVRHRQFLKQLTAWEIYGGMFWAGLFFLSLIWGENQRTEFFYWINILIKGYPDFTVYNGNMFSAVIRRPVVATITLLNVLALAWGLLNFRKRDLLCLCAIVNLSFFLIFILQDKGVKNHQDAYLLFSCLSLIFYLIHRFPINSKFQRVAWLIFLSWTGYLITAPAYEALFKSTIIKRPQNELSLILERDTEEDDEILCLRMTHDPIFPALTYAGRNFYYKTTCTWPLQFSYVNSTDYQPTPAWREFENKYYDDLIEHIKQAPPDVILIDQSHSILPPHYFVMTEYLKRKGFYESVLQPHYKSIGKCYTLNIYARIK